MLHRVKGAPAGSALRSLMASRYAAGLLQGAAQAVNFGRCWAQPQPSAAKTLKLSGVKRTTRRR